VFDIGSSLRDARLRQDLDFPELEERTKIRPKYLRALEEERFDILPAPTYIKGFLRTYADALGLDPQPFVDEYNSRFTVGVEDAPVHPRRVPPGPRSSRSGRESHIAVLALLAIAVVTALVIAAWRFGGPEEEVVPGLQTAPATQPSTPVAPAARLMVSAPRGASWMEVRSGQRGRHLEYSGTLERGQRKAFQARVLHLAVARPDNVTIRVNGRRVALPAGRTFVVTAKRIAHVPS
jgi:cytoskeleton protein RodZ